MGEPVPSIGKRSVTTRALMRPEYSSPYEEVEEEEEEEEAWTRACSKLLLAHTPAS